MHFHGIEAQLLYVSVLNYDFIQSDASKLGQDYCTIIKVKQSFFSYSLDFGANKMCRSTKKTASYSSEKFVLH